MSLLMLVKFDRTSTQLCHNWKRTSSCCLCHWQV
jgi:hypothetical protein